MRMKKLLRLLPWFWIASIQSAPPFLGVDANYSLGMEEEGQSWTWNGQQEDLFKGMARAGIRGFRVRLWVGDEGPHGTTSATKVVQRALAAGLDPYLVIFLSEDWADLMKQPAPKAWASLDLQQRASAIQEYSRKTVAHFRSKGLQSHIYEIGNEIDYGICGVYPGKSTKKTPDALARKCWPEAAALIKASQAGVLEADPEAKFLLHIAHWWDTDFVNAFFRFMQKDGVRLDYAGLSYFPSSNIGGSLEIQQFLTVAESLHQSTGVPVIIPEVAYPATADFRGQFSRWKKETPGYPLTPEGQKRWISDFLDACAASTAIASVYYWSPEWCGEGMWKGMALFDPDGSARPAWDAFKQPRNERRSTKTEVYAELHEDRFHPVPIVEAREKAAPLLAAKLEKHGRVNVDYIKDITDTELKTSGYQVHLRASLSGNLDLTLLPGTSGIDWRKWLQGIDSGRQRLVIFTRNPAATQLTTIKAAALEQNIEVVVHPIPLDKPLKFGFTVTKANSAY